MGKITEKVMEFYQSGKVGTMDGKNFSQNLDILVECVPHVCFSGNH